ncbi:cupin domain-containing protein [uncultured Gimesia sp.]|uniref:cupin domain-containing protein n=1 Tax=uncultured Gimesia sp. TaxID=1678688 RepID=UPI0030DCABE5|tara:strand:- start:29586 stop:29954 length:369 start_codon:yes stop_codon:yes gene_type:complete
MPQLIKQPTVVQAAGNKPKQIEEFVGRVNTGDESMSIARMVSPGGWVEPAQTPDFRETSIVLKGVLRVECSDSVTEVKAGQAIVLEPGEWVRYSTPGEEGAEYIAICTPAFSPDTVHRDQED